MKKVLAFVLAAMMILTCSLAMADRLDDILAAGKLVVATSPDWPPYEYIDDEGNVAGTDILMSQYFADQLGVELVIEQMSFDACLAAIGSGAVDMMVAGMTFSEERLDRMELTGIYWSEGDQGLLCRKGDGEKLSNPEAFKGLTVAAQNGTTQWNMIEEQIPDANHEMVTKIPDGVNMVKTGRIDALAVPGAVSSQVLAENDDLELCGFVFEFDGGNYLATPKGELALKAKVQEMIDAINAGNLYQGWMDQVTESQNK